MNQRENQEADEYENILSPHMFLEDDPAVVKDSIECIQIIAGMLKSCIEAPKQYQKKFGKTLKLLRVSKYIKNTLHLRNKNPNFIDQSIQIIQSPNFNYFSGKPIEFIITWIRAQDNNFMKSWFVYLLDIVQCLIDSLTQKNVLIQPKYWIKILFQPKPLHEEVLEIIRDQVLKRKQSSFIYQQICQDKDFIDYILEENKRLRSEIIQYQLQIRYLTNSFSNSEQEEESSQEESSEVESSEEEAQQEESAENEAEEEESAKDDIPGQLKIEDEETGQLILFQKKQPIKQLQEEEPAEEDPGQLVQPEKNLPKQQLIFNEEEEFVREEVLLIKSEPKLQIKQLQSEQEAQLDANNLINKINEVIKEEEQIKFKQKEMNGLYQINQPYQTKPRKSLQELVFYNKNEDNLEKPLILNHNISQLQKLNSDINHYVQNCTNLQYLKKIDIQDLKTLFLGIISNKSQGFQQRLDALMKKLTLVKNQSQELIRRLDDLINKEKNSKKQQKQQG